MFSILKKKASLFAGLVILFLVLFSCNKEFEDIGPEPTTPTPSSGPTLNDVINSDTSFSFFKAAIAKAGLDSILSNPNASYTIFAPDNNAFRLSGIPSEAVITGILDAATVRSLVSYLIVPQKLPAAEIPTTFPNFQYPTLLNPAPGISALLRLTAFPSRRDNGAWLNNIPIVATDIMASNGVIHKVAALVVPPSKSINEIVTADTSLSFLSAAMARADSGRTTIADGSLTEATKSIGANLTLFAPVNDAFRAFLTANGLPPSPVAFNYLPVETVRGIIAYHLLGTRAYSVNMSTTPTFIPTLLNGAIASHPGVSVQVTFTGPFVTAFTVSGVGNGGRSSHVIEKDINATNGVIHKIDGILLPQ